MYSRLIQPQLSAGGGTPPASCWRILRQPVTVLKVWRRRGVWPDNLHYEGADRQELLEKTLQALGHDFGDIFDLEFLFFSFVFDAVI
jgi:hypothetical protein